MRRRGKQSQELCVCCTVLDSKQPSKQACEFDQQVGVKQACEACDEVTTSPWKRTL